jgi:hypothetical protein
MTNVNETLVHEGITYRKVNRKANVGEKVLITWSDYEETGDVFAKGHIGKVVAESDIAMYELIVKFKGFGNSYVHGDGLKYIGGSEKSEYVVLDPVEQSLIQSDDLFVTEADVRNNPRQVIDLIANLAGRLTKAEAEIKHQEIGIKGAHDRHSYRQQEIEDLYERLNDRIDRLAPANEQAISTVARNVETWAQEHEELKREVAEGSKAKKNPQPKTFDFTQLAGKTLKIETGYDIADGLVCSTTIGYDEEAGKRYVLDSKITAINFHTGLNAEERREL